MYKLELKFVTPIKLKVLSKQSEEMLQKVDSSFGSPYVEEQVINTVTIEHAGVIPNKAAIAKMESVINETLSESIPKISGVNVEVAGPTQFEGFTSIEEE